MDDEEKQEETKPKRRKAQAVRVIWRQGQSALVEWDEGSDIRRGYVPIEEVEAGKCDEAVLKAAIPYGVPWEQFIALPAEVIAANLRKQGIWTTVDLEHDPKALQKAVNSILNINQLRHSALQYEGGNK